MRVVTNVECGMRWTLWVRRTGALAKRTAKSCGPDIPTLISSLQVDDLASDGGKKARSPGRARRKPLKPFAQGVPDRFGVPVVTMLVCLHFSHTRLRVRPSTRHSLRLRFLRRTSRASLGRFAPRERGRLPGMTV